MARQRLDLELVARGLAASRAAAKARIEAGSVVVDGVVVTRPAAKVRADQGVVLDHRDPQFVSRAGVKLSAALDRFAIDPAGRRCLDAGASTGGFTDCLLQRGAASVVAVDVGTDQLHAQLRSDRRVEVWEQTDIRALQPDQIGGQVSLAVADLSFISLQKALTALATFVDVDGSLLTLVKPQFEAGRAAVARGSGVIRDSGIWRCVLVDVVAAAADLGLLVRGATVSPITGASGNVEFMMWLQPGGTTVPGTTAGTIAGSEATIEAVVAEAEARVV